MSFPLHGVHPKTNKGTADMAPVHMAPPKSVTLYTAMHIGAPAVPVVKVGDRVFVGTLVAKQDGLISAPIHSSVSGTVKKIENVTVSTGRQAPAITIESDGNMTPDPSIVPPTIQSMEDVVNAFRNSGLVGLGGAGFPTSVKFSPKDPSAITHLIINGAECEPYITGDSVTMVEKKADIAHALTVLLSHYPFEKVLIAIEDNKPSAIQAMQEVASEIPAVEVKVLPTLYPQGGEKVLVYHLTGRVVPEGGLPADVGCVVINSSTLAAIGNYFQTGMPLVTRCVTVDGGAVNHPMNVVAPIGTSIRDLVAFTGGFSEEPDKILYGGPMMGIAVPSVDAPVLKNTNAVLCLVGKEAVLPEPTPCIRCGACTNHCPFGINPAHIASAYKREDVDSLMRLGANLCMECGCCAFICPAHRPLVHTNKLAKAMIRESQAKEKKA